MTPEQDEQVRRALAATARGEGDGGPLPAEVGDHLDALLADLSRARAARDADPADRAEQPGTRRDELAARRRRRLPEVLVAAATVAVIALAGGAVATGGFGLAGSSGGGDASSAGGSAADEAPASSEGADEAAPERGSSSDRSSDAASPRALTSETGPYRLRTATLRVDVARVARATGRDGRAAAQEDLRSQPDAGFVGCARPDVAAGQTLVDVLLDGAEASLVLDRRGADGTRAARVYSCDDPSDPVTETTVR